MNIIRTYTREAGVRNLEREIGSICRKISREVVRCGEDTKIPIKGQSIHKYLGVPKFRHGRAEEKDLVGVATGLAWTEVGGELLQTETTIMPGKGNLSLTGKLGEVMQESAKAAISYVRSKGRQLRLPDNFYENIVLVKIYSLFYKYTEIKNVADFLNYKIVRQYGHLFFLSYFFQQAL